MKRLLAVLIILTSFVFGDYQIKIIGNVAILKQIDDTIYAGTDAGKLFSFNHGDENATLVFELPKVKSYLDGDIDSKVVDFDKIGDKFALLLNGDYMSKVLATYEDGKLSVFNPPITGIKRIFLYDENTLLLLGIGSEIIYFDINSQTVTFKHKISDSPFGGIAYDREKNLLLLSNEGGVIYFFDTEKKKFLREKSIHKDNIFSVAMYQNRTITGSNDKSCYYEKGGFSKMFDAGFLVYSVALSDKFGAFTVVDGINIIDIDGNILKKIPYHGEIINNMTFYDEYLVGAGYDNTIHFWSYR